MKQNPQACACKSYFCHFCFLFLRYSITDAGCTLAEKLETVTGDSLSPVSTDTAATFVTDAIKSSSHASIYLTSDQNFHSLSTVDVSRNSKRCIDLKEEVSDLYDNSASSYGRFTSIAERKEEELKPAR